MTSLDSNAASNPRYVEDAASGFAMYCDENGLTLQEGRDLAERLSDELEHTADERASYLPPEKVDAE